LTYQKTKKIQELENYGYFPARKGRQK